MLGQAMQALLGFGADVVASAASSALMGTPIAGVAVGVLGAAAVAAAVICIPALFLGKSQYPPFRKMAKLAKKVLKRP